MVDDEQDLCEILQFNLESEGYEVATANSAEEALTMIGQFMPELILLDVMMDRMSGFAMAQQLRQQGNEVPIVFLTACATETEQLEGFHVGADDYITKPFSFNTVLARVRAVLKRSYRQVESGSEIRQCGAMVIDLNSRKVMIDGMPVELTLKEFRILALLTSQREQYFTREQILDAVWDTDTYVAERSVDVHIARLRKKLGSEGFHIVNKTNFGYRYQ